MTRKRNRPRTRGGAGGSLLRHVAVAVVVIAMASLVVQSAAFDTFQGSRSSSIDTAGDANALVGIDLPRNVPVGPGSAPCSFGDALNVTRGHDDNVNTDRNVVVTGRVTLDVTTTGSVRVDPGAKVDGDIDAGGCVILRHSATVEGEVAADGDVTLEDGATADQDISAGGDVTLQSGAMAGDDVSATGDVTVESGAIVDDDIDTGGDVTVEGGGQVGGSIDADGSVTVENGAQVDGDISEGGGSATSFPRLVTLANNQGRTLTVTVSLIEPSDGVLVVGGSPSGSSTSVSITSGDQQSIYVDPSSSVDGEIEFRIDAVNSAGGTTVTLERSVPTVIQTPDGGEGDDDEDDGDDRGGHDGNDHDDDRGGRN